MIKKSKMSILTLNLTSESFDDAIARIEESFCTQKLFKTKLSPMNLTAIVTNSTNGLVAHI